MQRDDHVPLKEIFGTPEALHEKIERIIDLALYEASDDSPLRLRFVTPASRDDWLVDDNYNDYRLTTPEEHQYDMDYVTVSYCWKHTQSSQGLMPIPQYRISNFSKNTPGISKSISCPKLVFHRAMLFARSRKCQFVWIDQECIDQADSADIQSHLKIMHRVYEESKWTVALLSLTIMDNSLIESLIPYLYHQEGESGTGHVSTEVPSAGDKYSSVFEQRIQKATTLLDYITQDTWFTRTWAFQEKRCASALFLLVPIEQATKTTDEVRLHMIGVDLCFDMAHFNRSSTTHYGHLHQLRCGEYREAFNFDIDRMRNSYATSWDRSSSDYGCYPIFRSVQDCENLVVADRIAVFGHVCQFRYRLVSDILHSAKYSFSAGVIALLLANVYIERARRFELVMRTWQTLEEHSKVQTAAPDLGAWILVLIDSGYRLPEDHNSQVRSEASTSQPGRRKTM